MVPADDTNVGDYLSGTDVRCIAEHCGKEVRDCANGDTGGDSCQRRLGCIQQDMPRGIKTAKECFVDTTFKQLDKGMMGIVDCSTHHKCLKMTPPGISLLQEEMKVRQIP